MAFMKNENHKNANETSSEVVDFIFGLCQSLQIAIDKTFRIHCERN